MHKYLLAIFSAIILTGCGEYNRVLKSNDMDLKYDYAKKAYDEGRYVQSTTLLSGLITPFRGTPKGEDALYLLAKSYFNNKDYMNSGVYFKTYYSRYPRGKYTEEARYLCAEGYDKESPEPQLDQSVTLKAIEEYQAYLDHYPRGSKVSDAQQAMFRLQDKLTLKELQNANLYYNLGMYLGNNYQSAVVVAQNALKTYPYTKYKEDFELLILKAKYQMAHYSVSEKQEERYRDVIDEYYSFTNNYPDSPNRKEADNIFKIASRNVKGNN